MSDEPLVLSNASAKEILERLDDGGTPTRVELRDCKLGAKVWRRLLEWMGHVTYLELRGCRIKPAMLQELGASPSARSLVHLGLGSNVLRAEGLAAIAEATELVALRSLNLGYTRIDADALAQLSDLPLEALHVGSDKLAGVAEVLTGFGKLRRLALMGVKVRGPGVETLAKGMPDLEHLVAFEVGATDKALATLAEARPKLETLGLRYDRIGDKAATAIAASCPELEHLQLSQCRLTSEGAKEIAKLERLQSLYANTNAIGAEGMMALAEALPEMRAISLGGNLLGRDGCKFLAQSNAWPKLEALWLSNAQIDDVALKYLAAWPRVAQLRVLGLDTNGLGEHALDVLRSVGFTRIEAIEAWQTAIPETEALPIRKTMPHPWVGSPWHRARFG